MPCCIVALLALFGPRLILFGIWLFNNEYLQRATENFLLQCLGFVFLPWTLLAFVFSINTFMGEPVFMGLDTTGVVITAIGFLFDLGSYGGGYQNRNYRYSR